MLQPKRTKFRRVHKMKMKGNANRGAQLAYGTFGIKAMEGAWITARQIEAARIAATRYMKRERQLCIKIFPDKPITKKQAEIKNLSVEDIKAKLVELRATYSKTKLAHKISPIENPIQIRDLRRTIARLETELTNKQ